MSPDQSFKDTIPVRRTGENQLLVEQSDIPEPLKLLCRVWSGQLQRSVSDFYKEIGVGDSKPAHGAVNAWRIIFATRHRYGCDFH
jgi:hypothetical protein